MLMIDSTGVRSDDTRIVQATATATTVTVTADEGMNRAPTPSPEQRNFNLRHERCVVARVFEPARRPVLHQRLSGEVKAAEGGGHAG